MNFKELAEKRFSARKYTDEPVSKADIDYIMECTRLAPSAHNLQPWKFLLLTSEEAKRKYRDEHWDDDLQKAYDAGRRMAEKL